MKLKDILNEVTDSEIMNHGAEKEDMDTTVSVELEDGSDIEIELAVSWDDGEDSVTFEIDSLNYQSDKSKIPEETRDAISDLIHREVTTISDFGKSFKL